MSIEYIELRSGDSGSRGQQATLLYATPGFREGRIGSQALYRDAHSRYFVEEQTGDPRFPCVEVQV